MHISKTGININISCDNGLPATRVTQYRRPMGHALERVGPLLLKVRPLIKCITMRFCCYLLNVIRKYSLYLTYPPRTHAVFNFFEVNKQHLRWVAVLMSFYLFTVQQTVHAVMHSNCDTRNGLINLRRNFICTLVPHNVQIIKISHIWDTCALGSGKGNFHPTTISFFPHKCHLFD